MNSEPGANETRSQPGKIPSVAGTNRGSRLATWRDLHFFGLVSSIGRLARRPFASALTVGVMAVALTLPLCLSILVSAVSQATGGFRASRDISLFLRPGLEGHQVEVAGQQIAALDQVASVRIRTPTEGLAEFRQMGGVAEALDLLDSNPLPAVVVVEPLTAADPTALATRLEGLPEVDLVQHDAMWRTRLAAWLELGQRFTLVVSILLGAGTLLVVGNTIRLDIQGRAEEIRTVQLLGASDGFIRRPFLYLGALYGVLSGLAAIVLTAAAAAAMQGPVSSLVASYGAELELHGLDSSMIAIACTAGLFLGWSGAWLASSHHLRQASSEERR